MSTLFTLCLVVVGLINFTPVLAMFSTTKLERAYAGRLPSKDLQLLMRHRALLFGVVGGFVLCSVFLPVFQVAAMVMAAISMAGFVVLAAQIGGTNTALRRVVLADLVGLAVLLVAVLLKVFFQVEPPSTFLGGGG